MLIRSIDTMAAETIRFLAAYAGQSQCEPSTSSSNLPQINTSNGPVAGLGSIARYYAQQTAQAQQLLGATPETQAQVRVFCNI